MKKIAIIGFGGHVQKNILPAISRAGDISVESVYVRDMEKYQAKAAEFLVKIKSVNETVGNVDAVYISTPITTHYDIAKKYLMQGLNVICEKPLTDSVQKTEELFDLADKHGASLHEVCMYQYHNQYHHLQQAVADDLSSLRSVSVKFSIPHLSLSDIRYSKKMGGGALLDVGYYPLSMLVSLFGEPKNIKSATFSQQGFEVDLTGYAVFEYNTFYCVAEWGIGVPYENELSLNFEGKVIGYPRIFSKPESLSTEARVKVGFDTESIAIGKDDHFVNMFDKYLRADSKEGGQRVVGLAKIIDNIRMVSGPHD